MWAAQEGQRTGKKLHFQSGPRTAEFLLTRAGKSPEIRPYQIPSKGQEWEKPVTLENFGAIL